MSEDLPDSFDPKQPDLPTLAVDPEPLPESHEGQAPVLEPELPEDQDGRTGQAAT
jgi:hypothetical protein